MGNRQLRIRMYRYTSSLCHNCQRYLVCFCITLFIYSESVKNADLMQRLSLVPKLLFVLHDDSVTRSTAHTIASVLSVLLSNTSERKNLLRYDTSSVRQG